MRNDASTVPVLDLAQCFVLVLDAILVAQPGVVLVCAMLVASRVVRLAARPREHYVAGVRAVCVPPHPLRLGIRDSHPVHAVPLEITVEFCYGHVFTNNIIL